MRRSEPLSRTRPLAGPSRSNQDEAPSEPTANQGAPETPATPASDLDGTAGALGHGSRLGLETPPPAAPPEDPGRALPPGVSPREFDLLKNAIYNEANGSSLTEMAKVAQAVTNYARRKSASIEQVLMGGRAPDAIRERYLADDPRRIKDGNTASFQSQLERIEQAALMGLRQEVPGFSTSHGHWRGNGRTNRFFH